MLKFLGSPSFCVILERLAEADKIRKMMLCSFLHSGCANMLELSHKEKESHSMSEYVTILWVAFDLLFFVPMPLKRLHRPRKQVS